MTRRGKTLQVGLPALLLASWLSPAGAQTTGAATPLITDGTVELATWPPDAPQFRLGQTCSVEGSSISCRGQREESGLIWSSHLKGTISGSTIAGHRWATVRVKLDVCEVTLEDKSAITLALGRQGLVTAHTANRTLSSKVNSGPCESWSKAESNLTFTGTWRQATIAEPALAAVPQPPAAAGSEPSVRVEGTTIYVSVSPGSKVNFAIVQATKAPPFSVPTVGGLGKEFERYVITNMYEASYGHLPPDMRASFISGMDMPSDVAGEAAEKAVQAAESAANWARNNPADVALVGLTVAVGVVFPVTVFAGGASLVSEVAGGAMLAGTVGFVSKLSKDFLTDKSLGQRVVESTVEGIAGAVSSVPGNLAGGAYSRALEAPIGKGIATTAITGGSVIVGLGADRAAQNFDLSQKTADLLMGSAPYRGNLVTPPPAGLRKLGGITIKSDQ